MKLVRDGDGYSVADNISRQPWWVFQDANGKWRPYTAWGRCMNSGRPGYDTPQQAAAFKDLE